MPIISRWWAKIRLKDLIEKEVDEDNPDEVNSLANEIADRSEEYAKPGQPLYAPEESSEMEESIEDIIDYLRMADTVDEVDDQIRRMYDDMDYLGIFVE